MGSRQSTLLAAIVATLSGIALLTFGWLSPAPPRINIRWTVQTVPAARAAAERDLQLLSPVFLSGRTWSYELRDTSPDHVGRILDHPAVEDRHYIGPGRTLTPDAPPLRAWLMARYGRPPVNWLAASWWWLGPLLGAAGLFYAGRYAWIAGFDARLAAILMASAGLRLWVILHGGQYYWPDEKRYRGARTLLEALRGDRAALDNVMGEPNALLLKVVGLVPARVEELTGDNPHVPALFFGACSLVCIWLVAAIARRLGATRDQSFLAALLAAGSTALLYMARHLTGYDLALMCGLFAVLIGVRRPASRAASVSTAIWSLAAFLSYAGAWPLAGAACAIHVADASTVRDAVRRAVLMIAGIVSGVAGLTLAYAAAGMSWVRQLRVFAGAITQGDFSEGWYLPFAYLWHAEHLLLIGWAGALAWCLWRFRDALHNRLTRAGLVGLVCIYASLAISSTILHRFVVYGRLSRPLVPFLCLIGASALGALVVRTQRPRTVIALLVLAVSAQAAFNFRVPLQQEYPAEFVERIKRMYPEPRVFVNAHHLNPEPDTVEIPAGYYEAASAPHPLEFIPYQYEGFVAGERRLLRSADIRMKVFVPAR